MSTLWELLFPFAGPWPRLFICSCLVYLHSWTHGPVGTLDHWASLNFMVKKAPHVYISLVAAQPTSYSSLGIQFYDLTTR